MLHFFSNTEIKDNSSDTFFNEENQNEHFFAPKKTNNFTTSSNLEDTFQKVKLSIEKIKLKVYSTKDSIKKNSNNNINIVEETKENTERIIHDNFYLKLLDLQDKLLKKEKELSIKENKLKQYEKVLKSNEKILTYNINQFDNYMKEKSNELKKQFIAMEKIILRKQKLLDSQIFENCHNFNCNECGK